ncbi:type II toxin-antitoxin system RelE/ParE family toxin [Aliidiomarina soli]|uniref:Plasmid stabilization protein n=1 Tax=Aliidiomarina soli TaxID=1928574 RepID=A0A432WMH0_9GAMM|nr:plasmid stabilization protein [Aliidiomarina soli]
MRVQLNVELHPDAEAELYKCIRYYDSQVRGLGAKFLNAFDSVGQRISTFPKSNAIILKPDIRKASLSIFPTSVIYRITPNNIEILAITHTRRKPFYWIARKPQRSGGV